MKYVISEFKCTECGNIFPLPRKKNLMREKGHIKTFNCPFCNKKQNFKEIRHDQYIKTMSGEYL